jgi:hypothetical protein
MNRNSLVFLVMCAGTALPVLADPPTIYVALCGDDSWTGASPVCAAPDGPKRTIQAGINASATGDVIEVADGLYMGPGNRDIDFAGRAISVRSAGGASACTIDCGGTALEPHRAFLFQTSEGTASILDGFTVQGGAMPGDLGGAVWCLSSSPTIRNCKFKNNSSDKGGAIFSYTAGLHLENCSFSQNTATGNGGAIYAFFSEVNLTGCTFSANTAGSGGGALFEWEVGNHNLDNCTFDHNSSLSPTPNGGGAIEVAGNTGAGTETWTHCRFIQNNAVHYGGGVWMYLAHATITNCEFHENAVANSTVDIAGGGGLAAVHDARLTLTNCLFERNSSDRPGAALLFGNGLGGPTIATVINCTFSQNVATPTSGAVAVTQTSSASLANCILWGNTPAQVVVDPAATATLSYSDIQGGWSGVGAGNIDADPRFREAAGPNYRLAPFSLCIDSGDNSAVPAGVLVDLDGLPRFIDDPSMPNRTLPPVDMGAYEFQYNSCSADFNKDGDTGTDADINDFFACLAGACCPTCPPDADFNGDGDIGTDADIEAFFRVLAGGAC